MDMWNWDISVPMRMTEAICRAGLRMSTGAGPGKFREAINLVTADFQHLQSLCKPGKGMQTCSKNDPV